MAIIGARGHVTAGESLIKARIIGEPSNIGGQRGAERLGDPVQECETGLTVGLAVLDAGSSVVEQLTGHLGVLAVHRHTRQLGQVIAAREWRAFNIEEAQRELRLLLPQVKALSQLVEVCSNPRRGEVSPGQAAIAGA